MAAERHQPAIAAARRYRLMLEAMARPGRVHVLDGAPSPPLGAAATALACTLVDGDARAWIAPAWREPQLDAFLRFETGAAPVEAPEDAAFVFGPWAALAGLSLPLGTPDYPDRAATLVIEVPRLVAGAGMTLSGPGLATPHRLDPGLPAGFWAVRESHHRLFPMGWDAFLTCGDRLAALPRTTRAEA